MQASTIHKKNPLELAMAARKIYFYLKLSNRTQDPENGVRENGKNGVRVQILTEFREWISKEQVLRPLAWKRGLESWEKFVNFTTGEWFPSRLAFGKFKGRLYQEAREDAELRSWLEWLAESTNERSSAMGRWDLGQLENGTVREDAAFLDLEIQEHAGDVATGLVVFQQPEIALYQRLLEAARNRLAELEYGIEKSKVDSIRSKLLGVLRTVYPIKEKRDAHSPKPPERLFYFPQCPTRDGMECQTVCSPVRPRCGGRGRRRCQVFLALLNSLY
jgi:hypothetical protein